MPRTQGGDAGMYVSHRKCVSLNQHPALRLSFGRLNGGLFGLGDDDTLTRDEIMSYLNRDLIAVSPYK